MLHCENVFCVYWADDTCWFETVNLDIQGRCDSCIYIDIDEPTLKKFRKSLFDKLERDC